MVQELWGGHGARRTGPGEDQADDSAALVYAAAMAPPYLFCAFLLIRDLLAQFDSTMRALRSRRSDLVPPSHIRGGRNTVHQVLRISSTARSVRSATRRYISSIGYLSCRAWRRRRPSSLRRGRRKTHVSRVALLYEKYLGLRGLYYRWKILGLQYLTILLQAVTKLPDVGAHTCGPNRTSSTAHSSTWDRAVGAGLPLFLHHACHQQETTKSTTTRRRSSSRSTDTVAALTTTMTSHIPWWIFVTKSFHGRFCRWTPTSPASGATLASSRQSCTFWAV